MTRITARSSPARQPTRSSASPPTSGTSRPHNPHMVRSAKVTSGRLRWSWDARFTWPLRLLALVLARVGGPLPCWSYQR